MKRKTQWQECLAPEKWDHELASFGGHPLQSTLWGNARSKVDHIPQLLLEYRTDTGKVIGLARVEKRPIPLLGNIAWVPKGPVLSKSATEEAEISLRAELKRRGFIVCVTDRYSVAQAPYLQHPKTIWLDLTLGIQVLSKNLDSQWRSRIKHALREGVVIRKTMRPTEISAFFQLCNHLSMKKDFSLSGSEALMQELIRTTLPEGEVGMSLYVSDFDGAIAGGLFIGRSGRHLHYFWGASDRRFSKYRVSEAIQWKIIEDGVASGVVRYDLEGIDPARNPGVYQFKRKMGGIEVTLQGMDATPLSWTGHVFVSVGRRLGRFQ